MSWLSEGLNMIFDPGKDDREKSNSLYQQSIDSQSSTEAWKKGLLQDRLDLSNKFLYGGNVQDPNAVEGSEGFEVKGALPQAQDWETQFFDHLSGGADTAYNAQRGALESSYKAGNEALASSLNNRGLSNSVLGASLFGKNSLNRASGLAGLEGERQDRIGDNIAQGYNASQGLLSRYLDMGNTASGAATSFNSNIPSMLSSSADRYANSASSAGSGIGNTIISEASRNMLDNMFPTTTASKPQSQAGGIGQQLLGKAADTFLFPGSGSAFTSSSSSDIFPQ